MSVILTVGGAISGYWATGRFGKAIAPTRVIRIAITAANTGRSMKKWESGILGESSR